MTHPQEQDHFMAYPLASDMYDEMWTSDGHLRRHWQEFTDSILQTGIQELMRRRHQAERLLLELGVTYDVHRDNRATNRVWSLDPIPFIIDDRDWATIEAGLIERAELLNLILGDLYGARTLLGQDIIPPELIYSHAGFLLPCDQTMPALRRHLVLYAADVVRGTDGRFWVLGERTQTPSGAGYALESRVTMNRVMSDIFRTMQVRRVDPYFMALHEGLISIAPQGKHQPRIVVLTSGPQDASYFEHAYLSAYLGYPLVHGDDLTVRDGGVWLKSIDGLQQVDIILRRVRDDDCDPLELNAASHRGVPGLLEAVRRGHVAVANPPGSGVLENPGLLAFLPAIARRFMDREPLLPSAATWWCGQDAERAYVLDNLERLIIKSIDRFPKPITVIGAHLSGDEAAVWRRRISAHPHRYAGQAPIRFSTAPTLINGRLEPRPSILRCFLVAHGDTYAVMSGGLARSASRPDDVIITAETGAISKDTWVLTETIEPHMSVWLHPEQAGLNTAVRTALPSRTAENLYWIGRYAERAEVTARLFRTVLRKMTERDEVDDTIEIQCLRILLRTLTVVTDTRPGFIGAGGARRLQNPESELRDILLSRERSGSLFSTLQAVKRAAYAVRDRWSTDFWRVIDDMEEHWNTLQSASAFTLTYARDNLDQLVTDLVALAGLSMESMTRDSGWILLDCGRRFERALLLITQLRAAMTRRLEQSVESLALEALLAGNESLITYRRRYRSYIQLQTVLELLLMDDTNPRGVIYQLDRLQEHLPELPYDRAAARLSEEERCLLEAASALRLSDVTTLINPQGKSSRYTDLDRLLAHLETLLERASDMLVHRFFSHTHTPQQVIAPSIGHDV